MPTLQEVKDQIKRLDGVSQFLGRREVKELPNILWEDELIENIVQGLYNNGNGILVATNKRLVFVDKGMLGGLRVEDFPYDKISSIQYQTGLMFGKITIFTSGNKAEITQVLKKEARDFSEYVRARVSGRKDHASAPQQPAQEDPVALLERLAQLKAQGILTEEEFAAKKRQVLGI